APGWWIGFSTFVVIGAQPNDPHIFFGYKWLNDNKNGSRLHDGGTHSFPSAWGDLMMLGTDATVAIQDADETGSRTEGIVPGHSYLLTVIDPDRNVNLATEDTVLLSAEVLPATDEGRKVKGEGRGGNDDVEIFVLKETGKNTGIFRGF